MMFLGVIVRSILTIGTTAVLARLLLPKEFGGMAMSVAVTELAALFSNFGLQSIIVQQKKTCRLQLDTVFWFNLLLGVILTCLVVIASFFAGPFFNNDDVGAVLRLAAITFILEELRVPHQALLYRLMDFRTDFIIQTSGLVVRSIGAISLAYLGLGVFSLVLGPLIAQVFMNILIWTIIPYRPRFRFDLKYVNKNIKVSSFYFGSGILHYCNTNLDIILIGRLLGVLQLGYYQSARALTDELRSRISTPLQRVLFPAYSQIQTEPERFRQAILRSTAMLSLIVTPLGLGIAATSNELVYILYGNNWLPMIPLLEVIAIAGTMRATLAVATPIFNAINRVGTSLRLNTINTAIFFLSIWVGSHWGAIGICWGGVVSAMFFSLVTIGGFRLVGLGLRKLLTALLPTYMAGLFMYCVVQFLHDALTDQGVTVAIRLVLLIISGAISYLVFLGLFFRPLLLDALSIVKSMVRARKTSQ